MKSRRAASSAGADAIETGTRSVGYSENATGQRHSALSLPDPEEGLRLISAFRRITQASVREAVIEFVTQISLLPEDHRQPSA